MPPRSGALTPSFPIIIGGLVGAGLGAVVRLDRHPPQGIYFAMITLALAQMVYFFCVPGALHRRRGRHPVHPARQPVRRHPLATDISMYWVTASSSCSASCWCCAWCTRPSAWC
jgi:branched-chain amino acid transport system permease protein